MQKFDFVYQQHELDAKNIRTVYEDSYEAAVQDFIAWVHKNGYIGYFDDKTIFGNPNNRTHTNYTDDLTKSCVEAYIVQYTLLNFYGNTSEPTEEKKVHLFMGEEIGNYISLIKELHQKGNVKNLIAYKGTLSQFDHTKL